MSVFDQTDIPVVDPNKDYYAEFVGEGKKFKDNQALARAAAEKDAFIERLKNEAAQVRAVLTEKEAELKTRTSLDEFLQKVRDTTGTRSTEANQASQPAAITEDKITEIVNSRLTATEKARLESQNVREVQEGLTKAFGPNYVSAVEAKANELGLGKDFIEDLAKRSPKAVFAALGVTPTTENRKIFSVPNTVMNTGGSGEVRNFAYYEKLRKTIPASEYYSPKIQNEMFEQARKLGDEF